MDNPIKLSEYFQQVPHIHKPKTYIDLLPSDIYNHLLTLFLKNNDKICLEIAQMNKHRTINANELKDKDDDEILIGEYEGEYEGYESDFCVFEKGGYDGEYEGEYEGYENDFCIFRMDDI